MLPVTAGLAVMGIQLGLFGLGLIPSETRQLTAVHMFIIIASQAAIFLLIAFFFKAKLKFTSFGFGDEISGKDLLLGFGGLIGVNAVSSIFMNFVGTYPDQFKDFNPELLRNNLYLFIFTVALLGPIYEEVIFRGFILGMLVNDGENTKPGFKKNLPAVIFTSLVFMAAHFDDLSENPFIGLPLFLLGFYFSFWAIRKNGVMLTIILHVSQNFIAAIMMMLQAKQL